MRCKTVSSISDGNRNAGRSLTWITRWRQKKQAVWRRQHTFVAYPACERKDEVPAGAVSNEDDLAPYMRSCLRDSCMDFFVLLPVLSSLAGPSVHV